MFYVYLYFLFLLCCNLNKAIFNWKYIFIVFDLQKGTGTEGGGERKVKGRGKQSAMQRKKKLEKWGGLDRGECAKLERDGGRRRGSGGGEGEEGEGEEEEEEEAGCNYLLCLPLMKHCLLCPHCFSTAAHRRICLCGWLIRWPSSYSSSKQASAGLRLSVESHWLTGDTCVTLLRKHSHAYVRGKRNFSPPLGPDMASRKM